MHDCKLISTILTMNYKLSSITCLSNKVKRMKLSRTPYTLVVGSSLFAMICIKPNIAQTVRVINQFMTNLGGGHWNIVKRVLRYIKGTSNATLCFKWSKFIVKYYVDPYFVGDLDKGIYYRLCSHLQEVLWVGFQNSKLLWLYLQQKQSIWQLHRLTRKLFGSRGYWKNFDINKRRFLYFVIVKVLCTL